MPFVTLYMAGIMAAGTMYLGINNFSAWKLFQLKEFNELILGKNGFLSTLWKDYLDYYKLDFHPEQHDSKALEESTKAQLGFSS